MAEEAVDVVDEVVAGNPFASVPVSLFEANTCMMLMFFVNFNYFNKR